MAYSLRRIKPADNAGDSGLLFELIAIGKDDNIIRLRQPVKPLKGYSVKVGSHYARSYQAQDWWMTTPITKIISEKIKDGNLVVIFKTQNSTYEWKGPIS